MAEGLRGPAYHVERDDTHWCEHCGQGARWDVVGPDGVAIGTTFLKAIDAEETVFMLSRAYELGRSAR